MIRRPETRLIRRRAVRVEYAAVAGRKPVPKPEPGPAPLPDRLGPVAIDVGHLLRHGPMRFPDVFVPAAWVGVR